MQDKIKQTLADYNQEKIYIGVLGSHSALESLRERNKKASKL